MRRGTVLRLRGFGVLEFFSKNGLLLLILLGLSIGIGFGVFSGNQIKIISLYTQNHLSRYLQIRAGRAFLRILLDSYMAELFAMLLLFASGTSMLGAVLVPAIAVGKGVLLGAFPAYLYAEYSIKGIAFHAVLVLPSLFLFLIVYLLAARESFQFSVMMAKLTLSRGAGELSVHFKNYCGRYLVLVTAALLSAILDAVLSVLFIGRFGL